MKLKLNKYHTIKWKNYIENRRYFPIIITIKSFEYLIDLDYKNKYIPIIDYHFIIKNDKIIDIYCEIIISKSLLLYLYKNNFGKYNNNLVIIDNKPFINNFNTIQRGGEKDDIILPFYPNLIYRVSLISLGIQRILINFLPADKKVRDVLKSGISMIRDKKTPLGKMFKFFYGDWFLIRFGGVMNSLILSILRVAPDPSGTTQTLSSSISLYNANNGLQTKIDNFKVCLDNLIGSRRNLFSSFSVLNEFFDEDKTSIFKIKANKKLIDFLKPKYIKYNIESNDIIEDESPEKNKKKSLRKSLFKSISKFTFKKGKPKVAVKYVYKMNEINKLFVYLKTELDLFLTKKKKNYIRLTTNIDKLLDAIAELLGAIMTFLLQFDCNISSFLIEIVAKKANPVYVFEIIKHIFKLIPSNIKSLILDKSALSEKLKKGADKLIETLIQFPSNLKENINKKENSERDIRKKKEKNKKIDDFSKQLEESGFKDIKDTLLSFINKTLIPKVYEVIDLFYILIPLILILSIIRSYNYKVLENKESHISPNRLGLLKLQNVASSIWLIEINKIVMSM